MRGAIPPAAWAFAILLASDMLFLRPFSGEFAPFAFSQCVFLSLTTVLNGQPARLSAAAPGVSLSRNADFARGSGSSRPGLTAVTMSASTEGAGKVQTAY